MKNLVVFLSLIGLFIISCGNDKKDESSTGVSASDAKLICGKIFSCEEFSDMREFYGGSESACVKRATNPTVVGEGKSCEGFGVVCVSGYYCNVTINKEGSSGVCVKALEAGEACIDSEKECAYEQGYECNYKTDKCEKDPCEAKDTACFRCIYNLPCADIAMATKKIFQDDDYSYAAEKCPNDCTGSCFENEKKK